ncbi:transmembrane protease serine 9-like [Daphnia pulex]|uniref:transmembrane protease serine 9-like n=1 Tax=Daphnia pulex TaxID=6669 RepID=UPI001EDDF61C|nr:transmembrane protease serine 9-like [Daphnia pulex]
MSLHVNSYRDIQMRYIDCCGCHRSNVPGLISGLAYYFGFSNPDFAHQSCLTPLSQCCRCRFVRPEIIATLNTFVIYACPINSDYIGVCCPDNTQQTVPATRPPPPPPPTPTTLAPITTAAQSTKAPIATTVAAVPTAATPKKGCGELRKQMTRIVGGVPADTGEWPWMAALLRDKTDQYCGGVLITDQHILTASHCVDKATRVDHSCTKWNPVDGLWLESFHGALTHLTANVQ